MIYRENSSVYILSVALVFFAIAPVIAGNYLSPGGSGGGSITLGAPIADTYSISAPSGITGWDMSPVGDGVNTQQGTMHVTADHDWKVSVSDADTTNTKGHMTEWDGSNYITSNYITSPMKISVQSIINDLNGHEVELPTERNLVTGGSTVAGGRDIAVTFKQPVSWHDKVLSNGHSYRIIIKFTISPN